MAPGSSSRRNAPPRSRLGTAIQMLLGLLRIRELTSSDAWGLVPTPVCAKCTEEQWQSSAWTRSSKLKPVAPKRQATEKAPEKFDDHFDTNRHRHRLQPYRYSFIFLAPAQASEPGSRSSLAWGWVQTFLRKSLGNFSALMDTIWSRVKQNSQYQWEEIQDGASHLISNPSLSSLILTGLQKSSTSFNSSEKDSSLRSRPRGNNVGGSLTIGTHYLKRRSIASNLPPSSEKWISVAYEDSRDKPSASLEKAQYKPSYSLRSENGETSDKKAQKEEKKRQRCRDPKQAGKEFAPATGGNASGISGGSKRPGPGYLLQLWWEGTLLEKLFQTQAKRLRRLVTVLTTSASVTEIREVTVE